MQKTIINTHHGHQDVQTLNITPPLPQPKVSVSLTQAQYDALSTKDPNTLYFIVEG